MTAKDIIAVTTGTGAGITETTLSGAAHTLESAITSAAAAVAVYLVSALLGLLKKKIEGMRK